MEIMNAKIQPLVGILITMDRIVATTQHPMNVHPAYVLVYTLEIARPSLGRIILHHY